MYTRAEGSFNRAYRHMMTLRTGCASVRPSEYRQIVDTEGIDPARYERELAECQTFARQINQEHSAANGAVAGAILWLLVGTAFGSRNSNLGSVVAGGAANSLRGLSLTA